MFSQEALIKPLIDLSCFLLNISVVCKVEVEISEVEVEIDGVEVEINKVEVEFNSVEVAAEEELAIMLPVSALSVLVDSSDVSGIVEVL